MSTTAHGLSTASGHAQRQAGSQCAPSRLSAAAAVGPLVAGLAPRLRVVLAPGILAALMIALVATAASRDDCAALAAPAPTLSQPGS